MLGAEHKTLADRAFIETTVRLHRAGEGAPYTGLKPAGTDFGPAIPAAERALESGNLAQVRALLVEELDRGLHARFEHAREMQKAPKAPKTAQDVAAARERVSAELGFRHLRRRIVPVGARSARSRTQGVMRPEPGACRRRAPTRRAT